MQKNTMKKTNTISYGSVKSYAQVKDRIKEFRTDCPNGLIETTPTISETMVMFKARIVKDKSNPASAEATGHSMGEVKGDKAKVFEKQESIAVGRALALLGYSADGEIASSEEMEEFLADKQAKIEEMIFELTSEVGSCGTIEDLTKIWATLSGEMRINKIVVDSFKARKLELQ